MVSKPMAASVAMSRATVAAPAVIVADPDDKADFVIPVNWESRQTTAETQRDPLLKDLLYIPPNDVAVQVQKRDSRIQIQQTKKEDLAVLPVHIRDCIEIFTRDWVVLKRSGEQYSRVMHDAFARTQEPPFERYYYEIDYVLRGEVPIDSEKATFEAGLIKPPSKDTRSHDHSMRASDRRRLLSYLPKIELSASDLRPKGSAPLEQVGTQLLVSAREVRFQLEIEPFWCCLFLYDMKKGRRISEDFSFDLNPPNMAQLLRGRPGPPEAPTMGTDAIFTISQIHSEIYLVLRIDKVLTGDVNESCEPYFKATTMKSKEITKLTSDIANSCERLSNYTQTFALGAVPIFAANGGMANPMSMVQFPHLARFTEDVSEESLPQYITRLNSEKERKKLKLIPGRAAVEMKVLTPANAEDLNARRVNPSLFPVVPFNDNATKYAREVCEFHDDETNLAPYLSYIHQLYVYPDSLNFDDYSGSGKHRNVSVNVRFKDNDVHVEGTGLKKIYGKSYSSNYVSEANTAVTYHAKKPQFPNEIKIELPYVLNPKHHLLFTMNHIVCQEPGKKDKKDFVAALPAAAVALPLFPRHVSAPIKDDAHALKPYLQLPGIYLSSVDADALAETELKFATKKPSFVVRTRLVSSIYSQDTALNDFFNRYDSGRDDKTLEEAILGLRSIGKPTALRFLPIILNELFRVMVVGRQESSRAAMISMLHVLVAATVNPSEVVASHSNTSASASSSSAIYATQTDTHRSPVLLSYVQYMFDNIPDARKYLFEELVRVFIVVMKERPDDVIDDACRYAWFVFDIVVRSMALKAWTSKELDSDATRATRFNAIAYDLIDSLLIILAKEVQTRITTGINVARELNRNVALFLKDLLTVMDRGQVFRLIYTYVTQLQPVSADPTVITLKFQALKIITDYEYYVPLNWPVPTKIPPISTLPHVFWNHHFLSGLFLRELEPLQQHPDRNTRIQAVLTFRNLLYKHDVDPRYQKAEVKARLFAIYMPYILMVIEQSSSIVNRVREKEREELQHWLLCFLFLLTTIDRRLIRDWWRKETQKRLLYFFVVLARCLDVFEYNPDPASAAAAAAEERSFDDPMGLKRQQVSNTLRNRKSMALNKAVGVRGSVQVPSGVTVMAPSTPHTPTGSVSAATGASAQQSLASSAPVVSTAPKLTAGELALPREVSLIVLDLLADFMEDYESDLEREQSAFMRNFFEVFLLLMMKNQAQPVLTCVWRFTRQLIFLFSKSLFRFNTTFAGDLTYEVLRHCAFKHPTTRGEATAIFYLLMKANNDEMKQFARMKLQATIGISKLVGEGLVVNDPTFHRTLELVRKQAEKDSAGSQFYQQVDELCSRIASVLHNSTKLDAFKYDPEMTAELYYEISKGYTDSPDLRVTWLESLATYHRQNQNFLEAAQCRIHISAIVSGYLTLLKPTEAIVVDKEAFLRLSPNITEDLNIPQGIGKGESICQTAAFTRKGLFDQLLEAVQHIKMSDLYESAIEVERFMAAIHKKNRHYAKLVECYSELHQFCEKIVKVNQDNSRLFANYYRVAFFGDLLPELDGKEFIYKEPPMVRLADITDRLKAQYFTKFGQDKVKVLPNKPVERSTLQAGNLYLQIVAVEEYLEASELKTRVTPFERKFNLSRFIFETPFTQSGKAQGDFKDQWKRKTILKTELPFPYVKKRILVVSKEEIILTPIETATEIIEGRVLALKTETQRFNPSTRTLQIVLQGSLLLQVNAGPLEIPRIFLGSAAEYPPDHVENLRQKMREFILGCHAGVLLNKKLISAEQLILQEKLEEGYADVVQKMATYQLGTFPVIGAKPTLDQSTRESVAGGP